MVSPSWANQSAIDRTNEASIALTIATNAMKQANEKDDRITALSQVIRAIENGMGGMRDSLRSLTVSERQIQAKLDQQRDQISRLLGVLMTIERASSPLLLIHPTGPEGAARSGMMVSEVTPALQREAETLRSDLIELATIRETQERAEASLSASLTSLVEARAALSHAISARTDLPNRFLSDPIHNQLLADSSETLNAFAQSLSETEGYAEPLPPLGFAEKKGQLLLPVGGSILRQFKEPDAAGVIRSGLVIAAQDLSLVSAPAGGTVRFSGPFLDYDNVIIIEPETDYLMVIAGLNEVYVTPGDIVEENTPIGLLGGETLGANDLLLEFSDSTGSLQTQTLYFELRENGEPLDPSEWLKTNKELVE